MPVEFECRTEERRRHATLPPTPPEPRPKKSLPIKGLLVIAGLAALVAAFAVALFLFVGEARREIALDRERHLQIGRCFDNGIGGVGRLIEVWNRDRGVLAFQDGHTAPYPFQAIAETACPQPRREAPEEQGNG